MNKQHDLASFRNAIFNMQVLDEDCWAALAEILLLKTLKKGDYLTARAELKKTSILLTKGVPEVSLSVTVKNLPLIFSGLLNLQRHTIL